AFFLHVGEERGEAVKVAGGYRVVLVVVAFGAAERRRQPYTGGGAHAVGGTLDSVFARLRASLFGGLVQPVVARGDKLFGRWIFQQIAGQLFARELIEGQVAIERLDDVVAIG